MTKLLSAVAFGVLVLAAAPTAQATPAAGLLLLNGHQSTVQNVYWRHRCCRCWWRWHHRHCHCWC
jgi:hypothetical protein